MPPADPPKEARDVIASEAQAHGVIPAFALARLQQSYPKLRWWYGPAVLSVLLRSVLS